MGLPWLSTAPTSMVLVLPTSMKSWLGVVTSPDGPLRRSAVGSELQAAATTRTKGQTRPDSKRFILRTSFRERVKKACDVQPTDLRLLLLTGPVEEVDREEATGILQCFRGQDLAPVGQSRFHEVVRVHQLVQADPAGPVDEDVPA